MRRLSANKLPHEIPSSWLQPISNEERLMVHAWVGEWAMAEPFRRQFSQRIQKNQENGSFDVRLGTGLILPFYQPQETINSLAKDFASMISKYDVPYDRLAKVVNRKTEVNGRIENVVILPYSLYNPLGRYLYDIDKPNYEKYMFAAINLEGGRRALLVTQQLRAEKTPRHNIDDALAASPYRNPYTNQPFIWNDASGNVVFEGLGEGKQKRYLFPY